MNMQSLIEGLTLVNSYNNDPTGYGVSADHDLIYAFATDRPMTTDDVQRMRDLGWFQMEAPEDEYDPRESWCAYV